ncbi:MAG: hypothetical protein L0387_39365 [Acidobacteria bacterium]|nr:hypothetical protein [Acidobacteriota bacterium]
MRRKEGETLSPAEPQPKAEGPPASPPTHGQAKRAPENEQPESKVVVVTGGGGRQPGKIDSEGGRLGRNTGDGSQAPRMTGPRTAHGRRRSSRNAVKHGIFSTVATIKGESRVEFDAFLKGLQESLRPVGALESLLVEKLALLAWRYRRMVIAEGAEIQKSVDFFQWDRDLNREHSVDSSLPMAKLAGGLIARFRTPEMIDRCIELLEELRSTVAQLGFDVERDRNLLATLYGTDVENPSRHSLLQSYAGFAVMAKEWLERERRRGEGERAEPDGEVDRARIPAEDCRDAFLRKIDSQIRWLRGCRKQFGAVEADRTQLELLTRRIPDAAKSDRLLRYEAALERGFDRALGQLERLQRMRLGLATLPAVRLELSG